MNKYVITGATSFIGKALVEYLVGQCNEVFVIIQPDSKNINCFLNTVGVTTVVADLSDVDYWFEEIRFADYFIHLAWCGTKVEERNNPKKQLENLKYSESCLLGAVKLGCKCFFFAGSQAEYGYRIDKTCETDICEPFTEYGKQKLLVGEKLKNLSNDLNINFYHGRIFSVYGVGDHSSTLVSTCVDSFLDNEDMNFTSGEQYWNFLYIEDAVAQIVKLLESKTESGIYNIAGKETRKLKKFIEEIHHACNSKSKMLFGSFSPKERVANLNPSIDKMNAVLGDYKFISFEEGIKNIIKEKGFLYEN